MAGANPDVVKRLQGLAEKAKADLGNEENKSSGRREAGWVQKAVPLLMK